MTNQQHEEMKKIRQSLNEVWMRVHNLSRRLIHTGEVLQAEAMGEVMGYCSSAEHTLGMAIDAASSENRPILLREPRDGLRAAPGK